MQDFSLINIESTQKYPLYLVSYFHLLVNISYPKVNLLI